MLFVVVFCLTNVLRTTEGTDEHSQTVSRKDLNNTDDNSSKILENTIHYSENITCDKVSDIQYVSTTFKNISNTLNQWNNSEFQEIFHNFKGSTSNESITQVFNDTSVENEKRQFDHFNDTERINSEFQTAINDSRRDSEHNYDSKNTDYKNPLLNETNKNNSFFDQGLESISITDITHQYLKETSLKRSKRNNANNNVQLQVNMGGEALETNNNKKEQETKANMTRIKISTNESDFDKTFEYSEEDLSVGVHTRDNDNDFNTNYGSKQETSLKQKSKKLFIVCLLVHNSCICFIYDSCSIKIIKKFVFLSSQLKII